MSQIIILMPVRQIVQTKKLSNYVVANVKEGEKRITGELLICDPEECYGKKLAEALLLRKEVTINVRNCSSLEILEHLLEIGNIKVLLISEDVPYTKRKQIFNGKRIVLTRSHCSDLGSEEEELRKYQSVDLLSAEIMKVFQKEVGVVPYLKKKRGRIIAVYSPIHRIGKTTFSLKLGKKLSEKENVLYLNLETYAGKGGYFKDSGKQDLSHLLYYAKQEQDDISLRIASMVQRMGNLDYVPPMQVWTDLKMISAQEWARFFEKIIEQSVYDTIVLDVGNSLENVFEVLNLCDFIFLLFAQDVYGSAKMRQFEHMIHVLGYQELERRLIHIDAAVPTKQSLKIAVDELENITEKEHRYATGGTTS